VTPKATGFPVCVLNAEISVTVVKRFWPHLRALLILVHLFAISVLAMPAPGSGLNRSAWSDPTVTAEFDAWRERLASWGVDYTADEFEEQLWTVAETYQGGVNVVVKPFRPYYRYCGTQQSWRMFVAPHRNPAILHFEIHEEGEWRPLYVEGSTEYTWNGELLDHDRARSAMFRYAWSSYRRDWRRFSSWFAQQAANEFPEATQLRAYYWKYRTLSPADTRAGVAFEGAQVGRRVIELEDLRNGDDR
jgi:hypothetical protein